MRIGIAKLTFRHRDLTAFHSARHGAGHTATVIIQALTNGQTSRRTGCDGSSNPMPLDADRREGGLLQSALGD
jgi:hypothetical protein